MTPELVNKALNTFASELEEAKVIIDAAIEKKDLQLLYKTYSISKILYKYLEEHLKADEPLAKSVDKWLKHLAVYIQENAKR